MSVISPDSALNYLNILREYMVDRDIQAAIKGEAFYLAALGLYTYTEILGGLYCGDLKKALGEHYTCFINEFFHSDYMRVDQNLKGAAVQSENVKLTNSLSSTFIW